MENFIFCEVFDLYVIYPNLEKYNRNYNPGHNILNFTIF